MHQLPLRALIVLLALMYLAPFSAFAQNSESKKIVLKSGKSYIGELILQNNDVIILKLSDDTRFQFSIQDIDTIEAADKHESETAEASIEPEPILSGIVDISAGIASAKYKTLAVPFSNASITFGSDKFGDGTFFVGLGAGFIAAFLSAPDNTLSFVPVFIKGRKVFRRSIVSPYLSLDMGYAFASQNDYSGGMYSKINFGFQKRITYKTSFYAGVYTLATAYGGMLTEHIGNNNYIFNGKTAFVSGGLSAGIQF